jgi:cystathionine beta-lyase/cystathionine gamma-synthase
MIRRQTSSQLPGGVHDPPAFGNTDQVQDDGLRQRLWDMRRLTGAVASADTASLLLRGLKTLELRVIRQAASAAELADRLRAHPAVSVVRYPGLGGLISFDARTGERPRSLESLRLIGADRFAQRVRGVRSIRSGCGIASLSRIRSSLTSASGSRALAWNSLLCAQVPTYSVTDARGFRDLTSR